MALHVPEPPPGEAAEPPVPSAAARPPAPSVTRSRLARLRLAWPPAWRAPISPPLASPRAVPSRPAWQRLLAVPAWLTSWGPPPFSLLPPSAPPSRGSGLPCDVAEPHCAKPQLHDLSPRFRPIPSCLTPSNRAPCVIAIRSVVRRVALTLPGSERSAPGNGSCWRISRTAAVSPNIASRWRYVIG